MSTKYDEHILAMAGITIKSPFSIPPASIVNSHVAAGAGFEASKLQHQHVLTYKQDDGSDIVAAIVPIYIMRGLTGIAIECEVVCIDAPEGGDKHFTVDLQKANEGSPAPTTILDAILDSDTYGAGAAEAVDCEVGTAIIDTPALVAEDTLLIAVAVAGATGNQGQGLIVTVTIREDAE